MVSEVVVDVARRDVAPGDALAAEKDEFIRDVSGGIAFVQNVARSPIPVELAIGFLHAAAIAVVGIGNASGSLQFTLRIPDITEAAIGENVACGVVGEPCVRDA